MRYIRAGARLCVYPSVTQKKDVSGVPRMQIMLEIVNVLEPSLPPVCDLVIDRDGGRVTHRVHVDRSKSFESASSAFVHGRDRECVRPEGTAS